MGWNPLTAESFRKQIGTSFEMQRDPREPIVLELHSVEELLGSGGRPDPFSLIFTGPAEDLVLQGTYRMRHATMSEVEIFIVPIGPDPESGLMRYEAVFN